MIDPKPTHRRSLWPVLVPLILVVALAIVWTGLWFYAAAAAEETLDGWRAREAKSGRVYSCATQTIGGYPFRFEVRCVKPAMEKRKAEVTEAMAGNGWSIIDNDDTAKFLESLPRPAARAGAAVVLIDHTTKNGEPGNRFAIGRTT